VPSVMPEFIPGLELGHLYYVEVVRPILEASYPGLAHSAGLIGTGSEVLGFDTEMSTDHDWGPRVILYLSAEDHARFARDLHETLGHWLPHTFRGYSTHLKATPGDPGALVARPDGERPIQHRVQITTLAAFLRHYAGLEPDRELAALEWLTIPEQHLRSLVAGAVYHDGLHVLEPLHHKLAYYPRDVWLYLLSAQWQRIGQEEPFVGRAGTVGDEIGSAIIASRLVRDLMRLCMLMERQYAPYPKWFGSAFARLACAERLAPVLQDVLSAGHWQQRERHLAAAYEIVAAMHNDLGITRPMPARVTPFFDRPFMVIQGEDIGRAIWETITDPEVRSLPYGVGKVDQYLDSTDVLSHVGRCRRLGVLYTG
jgi:hypothetical protein